MKSEKSLGSILKRVVLGPHTLSPNDKHYTLSENGTFQLAGASILGGIAGYIATVEPHQQESGAIVILTGLSAIRAATEAIGSFRLANMARRQSRWDSPYI